MAERAISHPHLEPQQMLHGHLRSRERGGLWQSVPPLTWRQSPLGLHGIGAVIYLLEAFGYFFEVVAAFQLG